MELFSSCLTSRGRRQAKFRVYHNENTLRCDIRRHLRHSHPFSTPRTNTERLEKATARGSTAPAGGGPVQDPLRVQVVLTCHLSSVSSYQRPHMRNPTYFSKEHSLRSTSSSHGHFKPVHFRGETFRVANWGYRRGSSLRCSIFWTVVR